MAVVGDRWLGQNHGSLVNDQVRVVYGFVWL